MGNWYYFQNGQQVGPVDVSDLRILAANGELTGEDQVWQEGMAEWTPAGQVPGLLSPRPSSTSKRPTPSRSAPSATRQNPKATAKKKSPLITLMIVPTLAVLGILGWFILQKGKSGNPAGATGSGTVSTPPSGSQHDDPNAPPLSADTGDLATRLYNRGVKSLAGDGVPQDNEKGRQLLQQASQLGNADASCALAKIYAKGEIVKKDAAEAVRLFTKAAEKGNVEAMTALGSAYEHGTGVAADPVAAKQWYDKAAASPRP